MSDSSSESAVYRFEIPRAVYSKAVLLRIAYRYLEDYYLYLDAKPEHWVINIKPKEGVLMPEAHVLEGQMQNLLINEEFRESLLENTKATKQLIVSRALFGATYAKLDEPTNTAPPKKIFNEEEFFANDEFDDYVEDPLQIGVPWEERFGKKEKKGDKNSGVDEN